MNSNSQTHGVFSYNLDRLYDRLARDEPETRAWVDSVAANIEFRADADRLQAERARNIALTLVLADRAMNDVRERGPVREDGTANPCLARARRLMSNVTEKLTELGVFEAPEPA